MKVLWKFLQKLFHNFIICFMLAIIVYLGFSIVQQEIYISEIRQETAQTQQRLAEAQKTNAALKQEKENLNKPEYVEKVAREELGMTKPGEVPYISAENK